MDAKYMTAAEAAERLGVSTRTVARWIEAGRVQADRIGEHRRILRASVEDLAGHAPIVAIDVAGLTVDALEVLGAMASLAESSGLFAHIRAACAIEELKLDDPKRAAANGDTYSFRVSPAESGAMFDQVERARRFARALEKLDRRGRADTGPRISRELGQFFALLGQQLVGGRPYIPRLEFRTTDAGQVEARPAGGGDADWQAVPA